ncbi:MAG: hypothetical protein KGJ98_10670 [Chloroflexota bacterium]|nr:hypothetical protein [Chloroflexota bacterium]
MDQVPLERPRPRLPTLALLVGRVTTIKLAYWSALTVLEVGLGLWPAPVDERFPVSVAAGVALTLAACVWAAVSARARDARAGTLERSIPTVATTFVAASVVASPASLPLLIIERQRSLEGCFPVVCHWEAIWWWVAALVVGTILIPLVFAVRMHRPAATPPSA